MASEVGLANNALILLGELPILAISATTKAGRTFLNIFADKRDWLLREYAWKFATKRTTLAPDVATPEFEFTQQFTLPADYLKFIEIYPNTISYRIEKNKILCDETSLQIKYTQRITDVNEMDVSFREAFSALLARESCYAITDSKSKYADMDTAFEDRVLDAKFQGSIEDDLEEIQANDWLQQRF
jgi:hypothetical protein